MGMTIDEQTKGPNVAFEGLEIGDCFIDADGNYRMKIEEMDEGNSVVLSGRSAGLVLGMDMDFRVTKVNLIARIAGGV